MDDPEQTAELVAKSKWAVESYLHMQMGKRYIWEVQEDHTTNEGALSVPWIRHRLDSGARLVVI